MLQGQMWCGKMERERNIKEGSRVQSLTHDQVCRQERTVKDDVMEERIRPPALSTQLQQAEPVA